jgi:hypothetical protein
VLDLIGETPFENPRILELTKKELTQTAVIDKVIIHSFDQLFQNFARLKQNTIKGLP